MNIRLGILGLSQGNGHPYSWSSIFNGYQPEKMLECPFPAIPEYLSLQNLPSECIIGCKVTHIWTQNLEISKHIAESTFIDNIVADPFSMIGKVDAILLARDDANNHIKYSMPFIKAGLPIYIDKPLAYTIETAKFLLDQQLYPGQIFSCSALRYSRALSLDSHEFKSLGSIKSIVSTSPKDWKKYSVHAIEPARNFFDNDYIINSCSIWHHSDIKRLSAILSNGIQLHISTTSDIPCPIYLEIFAERGYKRLEFSDTFYSFKSALQHFVDSIQSKIPAISPHDMLQTVRLIEAGL